MVKTATNTSDDATRDATKKKSLFRKIFKKNKKKSQEADRKVEIVVENVVEEVEDAREDEEVIPRDPSAMEPSPEEEAEEASSTVAEPFSPVSVSEDRDGADILADLQQEESNPTPIVQQKGWIGGWLDNMTYLCAPPDQGLPTIMSGEEMDMDEGSNGGSMSVMSPTSTVHSEAPLSPTTPKVEKEGEGELNKKKEEPETKNNKKEEKVEEKKMDEAKTILARTPKEEQKGRKGPVDAPTTPKSPVMSPRANKFFEPEEEKRTTETPRASETPKASETRKAPETPKDLDDNTLILSPEKDDTVQEMAEPSGKKMDIFASFTACCNPVAAPSMDETEGIKAIEDAPEASMTEGPKEPDGDKDDENKSVAKESKSVMFADEKKEEETTPLPTTPANGTAAKDAKEEDDEELARIVGTIHKEKKNTKMGLSLKNSTMYQGVFIAKIKAGSLFSKTDLREGMQVLEIQGKPCPTALEEAVSMLRHAVGDLEIVAQKPKCEI